MKTYGQLVGVRFLFGTRVSYSITKITYRLHSGGVAYGGLYGLIMSTVLEATPRRARGIVAGFTQQGFSAGYLFASALHLAMSKHCCFDSENHLLKMPRQIQVGSTLLAGGWIVRCTACDPFDHTLLLSDCRGCPGSRRARTR